MFDGFDPHLVAHYGEGKIQELLSNKKIIRNKLKIRAAITNAQAFINVQKTYGSFEKFIWQFTDFKTIRNKWKTISEIPASTPESDQMSKELKKLGFNFVGPTICYANMQATGMVNDHTINCFRYAEL